MDFKETAKAVLISHYGIGKYLRRPISPVVEAFRRVMECLMWHWEAFLVIQGTR